MSNEFSVETGKAGRHIVLRVQLAAAACCLLLGGALLDFDRVRSAQEQLDRAAHVAAFEAAASRAGDRQRICERRFAKAVWTDSEVHVDDIGVSVTEDRNGQTAVVSYDATVQLVVGRFFGLNEIEISGEAEVTAPGRQTVASAP